jgi:Cys-rich repeat protein
MVCSRARLPMRLRTTIAVGAGLAAMLASQASRAVTFPQDGQWVPLTCNGRVLTDVAGEVQPPAIDAVGDAADPAAYFFMDSASLFLRLRMAATATSNGNTFDPDAWACLLRTANTPASYLLWDGVDGLVTPNEVELLQNLQPRPGNPTQQPATMVVATYAITTNARESPALSNLGGTQNVFVDWGVSLSDLAKTGITASTPLTLLCGTSKTQRILDGDIVGDEQGCPGGILDAVECPGGSCSPCTTVAACGPECVDCGGATLRCNPAFGCTAACTTDAQCGGATPVCDTARGFCVGCTSNANCPAGTTCNTASGFCVGCTSNATCPGGTYCDSARGTCAPCPEGSASCAGVGSGANNVLANGSIEGGSCACDAVGGKTSSGSIAGFAFALAAVLRARSRRAGVDRLRHHDPRGEA